MNWTIKAVFDVAYDAALAAGEVISTMRSADSVSVGFKAENDLVTNADLASEHLILEYIKNAFPTHTILSEETTPQLTDLTQNRGPLWVIDPIDGTTNYACNHPHVSVSIAFFDGGEAQVGVVHAPFQSETFTAIRGKGAWLNGEQIHVNTSAKISEALIATGFPPSRRETLSDDIERVRRVLSTCRDIRRLASAALDCCWVACGRLEGYYETVRPWDIAAGGLIAREAGARSGSLVPSPPGVPQELWSEGFVLAAPQIYDELHTLLQV